MQQRVISTFFLSIFLLTILSTGVFAITLGSDIVVDSDINVSTTGGLTTVSLSNGNEVNLEITSVQAKQSAATSLGVEDCSNCKVELTEVRSGSEVKAAYRVETSKVMRILGVFRTNAKVVANIDAENGETISVNKPWWSFLAAESKTSTQMETNGTDTGVSANSSSNANVDLNGEWCTGDYAREVYATANANANDNFKIVEAKGLGFVQYDGKRACHVYTKVEFNAGGQTGTSETDVYSYEQSSEAENLNAWVISKTTISGQSYEYKYHWVNGVCAGGNGCDMTPK